MTIRQEISEESPTKTTTGIVRLQGGSRAGFNANSPNPDITRTGDFCNRRQGENLWTGCEIMKSEGIQRFRGPNATRSDLSESCRLKLFTKPVCQQPDQEISPGTRQCFEAGSKRWSSLEMPSVPP